MTDTPAVIKSGSSMPYIWAMVIVLLIGAVFILAILYMRPQTDPLIVIPAVAGVAGIIFGQIATLLKTQETHLTVNSQSTEARVDIAARAHAEGMLQGAAEEQARIAVQVLNAAAVSTAGLGAPAASAPVPVAIVSPTPIPVEEVKKT